MKGCVCPIYINTTLTIVTSNKYTTQTLTRWVYRSRWRLIERVTDRNHIQYSSWQTILAIHLFITCFNRYLLYSWIACAASNFNSIYSAASNFNSIDSVASNFNSIDSAASNFKYIDSTASNFNHNKLDGF